MREEKSQLGSSPSLAINIIYYLLTFGLLFLVRLGRGTITALNDGINKMNVKMVVCPATIVDYTLFNTLDLSAYKQLF